MCSPIRRSTRNNQTQALSTESLVGCKNIGNNKRREEESRKEDRQGVDAIFLIYFLLLSIYLLTPDENFLSKALVFHCSLSFVV